MIINPNNIITVGVSQSISNANILNIKYARVLFNDEVHYRFLIKPRELDQTYVITGFDLTNQFLECNQYSQIKIYNNSELINTFISSVNKINIYSVSNIDSAVIDIYVRTNNITTESNLICQKSTSSDYPFSLSWPWYNVKSVYRNNKTNDVFDIYNCFLSEEYNKDIFNNTNIILLPNNYNVLLSDKSMPILNQIIMSQNISNSIITVSGSNLICSDNIIVEYIPPLNVTGVINFE